MENKEMRRIVEALILASPEPVSAARLAEIIPYCKPGRAKDLINELNTEYEEQDRAFEIWEVAGGYQIRTRAEFSGYLQKLQKQRPLRLSRAALETLAIVAYKQPVTRGEVEDVRGVDAGPVMKSLLERQLIRMAGQREVPGRPMLYATSKRFLEVFGLESLKQLPTLRDLKALAPVEGEGGDPAEAAEGEGTESAENAEATEAAVAADLAPSDDAGSEAEAEAEDQVEAEGDVELEVAADADPTPPEAASAAEADPSSGDDSAEEPRQG